MSLLGRALLCSLLLAAIGAAEARASDHVIEPGFEPLVGAMLGEGKPGGCTLDEARIETRTIAATYDCPDGSRAALVLEHPTQAEHALATTTRFAVVAGSPPPTAALVRDLTAELLRREADFAWKTLGEDGPLPIDPRIDRAQTALRSFVWLLLAVLLGYLVRGASATGSGRVAAGIVFSLALALRVIVPPWAPLHVNDHGIAEVGAYLGASVHSIREAGMYSAAYLQLMHVLLRPWPHASAVFAWGSFFGALACALAVGVASRLAESRLAGFLAGVALAVLPAFVRLSASESPWAFALACTFGALQLLLATIDSPSPRRRHALAWAGGCLLALGAETHPETSVLPGVVVLVLLGAPGLAAPGRTARVARVLVGPALLVALVLGLFALQLSHHDTELGLVGGSFSRHELLPAAVAMLRSTTSLGYCLGALAGWLLLLARRPPLALALGASALGFLLMSECVRAGRSDTLRYLTPGLVFLTLAAAVGPVRCALDLGRGVVLVAIATTLCLAAGFLVALPALRRPTFEDAAYADLAASARALPPSLRLRLPHFLAAGPSRQEVRFELPGFLLAERGRSVLLDDAPATTEPACFVYVAPACYRFTTAEVADGVAARAPRLFDEPLRDECASLVRRAQTSGPTPFAHRLDVPDRNEEFDVIVGGRPLVGFLPCAR